MTRYIFQVFALLTLISSCDPTKRDINTKTKINLYDSLNKVFEEDIRAFNFHIDDSTCLIFSNVQSFDTSFVLILKSDSDDIDGSFSYYPPTYYSNFGEWESINVFLFKSVHFKLAKKHWLEIMEEIQKIPDSLNRNSPNTSVLIHPALNKFYFENKILTPSTTGSAYFDQVYKILYNKISKKILLLYPVIDGKIP